MMRAVSALVLVLLASTPAVGQRLGDTVVPEHYTLWFAPDLEAETFRGRASIDVVLTEASTTLTLHAAELEFGEVIIEAGGRRQTARVAVTPETDTATFTVAGALAEGPATIHVTYTGVLNDKLRGFYISQANGRKYAVTQLEATDARRAFPSFDEPAYKATFDISLTIDAGDTAISNGRLLTDTPGPEPGTHTLTFARTPRMSTYLAAMVVGDFVCREGGADGTPIRVCATPDKRALTAFALEAAEQQLAFFNDYFSIDYPFGKLDLIAVPDFSAGAMENVGAITFRERLLLLDPDSASLGARKNVASLIAHELAHQWFGNLVTMKWWDDIWLNEGFATWMANKPLAVWRPEWQVDLDDAASTQGALGIDALRSTRAIRLHVDTPAQILEVFDGIVYQKTAAVLRMIEAFVGPEAFRTAVASYLRRFAFSNAAGEDFWSEVASVTGMPVDRILRSYVDQPGAPVLRVDNACRADGTDVRLDMSRFIGAPGAAAERQQTWVLPVCMRTGSGTAQCEVIDRAEHTMRLNGCASLVANADSRGYYFTEYASDEVRALAESATTLSPVERIGLLGDEWWMVRAGRHDIDVYLDLASALAGDENGVIADTIAGRLTAIGDDLVPARERASYRAWIRRQIGPRLETLGPEGASDTDRLQRRRATLMALVGGAGDDAEIQRQAQALAAEYIAMPDAVSDALAPTVLRIAALSGDAALYDTYLAQLDTLDARPGQYFQFFGALSWFRDPALVTRTLEFAVSPDVRSQDAATLIGGLLSRPSSRDAAWAFVRARWTTLTARLEEFQSLPTIVGSLGTFCSTARAREVRQFFVDHPLPSSERTIRQAVERIENCAALAERQTAPLTAWLGRQ
jgi:aminopeptidase N